MRAGIIDSGVNATHPHVSGVVGGRDFTGTDGLYWDLLGHGTAVAGAICEKAPGVELYIARVFAKSLRTEMQRIVDALYWCMEQRVNVVNLSLGTTNVKHRDVLEQVVEQFTRHGVILVSAREMDGTPAWPGSLQGVVGVMADSKVPRDTWRVDADAIVASPYPRPIPGRAEHENLSGVSFAVANVTGFIAGGVFTVASPEKSAGH